MKCPKCQFENPEGMKFCVECGNKLELICPKCGFGNSPSFKFCGECGHDLSLPSEPAPKELSFDEKIDKIQRYLPKGLTEKILAQRDRIEGERKQVTVMFCDLEGFTQLSERLNPEEVYSIMDEIYEILIHKVHDYEGTVNEMTGDGILALFGAPIALEDAPQRAIRSALAIHREIAKFSDKLRQEGQGIPALKMRIGIHTGPVVVGTLGNNLRVEFKAVGDTVNLASRMEGLAEPGATYVTGDTFKLTEGLFRFEALGKKEIKGKEEPIQVYRAIASSTSRTRFDVSAERGLTPFVGRERELELLLDGLERAKGGLGQAFSIVSEAGIGKSRLLYELRKAVSAEDVTFLEGKCLSYSRGVAYHLMIDSLRTNFDIRELDGDSQITEKIKKGLRILDVDESLILPYFLELFSVKDSGIDRIALSPEAKKDRLLEAFKQIVLKGSEIRPLIAAYEDLHWADKSSEESLKAILDSIAGARVLMIFTYRPEFVHTWGGRSYHSQLNLNRLSNRETLIMVSHFLGTEKFDKDIERLVLEKTEGVPFFIEELISSLRDRRIIEKKDNRYHLAKDIREVIIPSTIQDVIMARMDALPERAKGLLQTGSVAGREFSYDLIKTVTDFTEQELLSNLSVLKDSELLYERGIYPQTTYIFKHALTQEVAYNSLLLKRKKEIHEEIGKAIEALYPDRLEEHYELLAYQYASSDKTDKALEYLDLANQKAAKLNAMEEAKAYFDEAMKLLDALPETQENREQRISLLVNQGIVVMLLVFKYQEYYDLLIRYEPMAKGLGNPKLLGAYYARLADCEYSFGNFDQAIQRSTKAAELAEASGNVEEIGYAYIRLEWSHFMRGDFDRVLALKEDLLRTVQQQFNLRWHTYAVAVASRAYGCLGRWKEAVEEGQKALRVAEEFSDNSLISWSASNLSIAYTWRGDLARALEYGELALRKAPTPADIAFAQRGLGWALCRAGEANRGIELLTGVLPIFRAGFMASEIPLTCYLGEAYFLADEQDKAGQTLEKGLEIAERCGARYYAGFAQRLLGELALKANPAQAAAHFEKSISIFREIKAENELAHACAGYGRYHRQKGGIAQAREYLTKGLNIFERLGTLIEPDKVREALAQLPGV